MTKLDVSIQYMKHGSDPLPQAFLGLLKINSHFRPHEANLLPTLVSHVIIWMFSHRKRGFWSVK